MQAPKHELFMLNWEIFDLNKKLKRFGNVYSVIDSWTVDRLSQLIATVDIILTGSKFKPDGDWDQKDQNIFQGYSFHHSINCKRCGRAVKIAKPSLLKHLNDCDGGTDDSPILKDLDEDVLQMLCLPRKIKPGKETKGLTLSVSQQNRPKQVESVKKPNQDNVIAKTLKTNESDKRKRTRRGRRGGSKSTIPNPIELSKSDTSFQSSSTVSSRQNDAPKKTDKPKKLNEPKNDSTSTKKDSQNGNVPKDSPQSSPQQSKRDTSAQSCSSKSTIAPARKQADNDSSKRASQKPPKPVEPKRKVHRPNRARDGEYVTRGSIPNNRFELTKKTRKFVINVKMHIRSIPNDTYRKELSNSPAHDNIVNTLEGLFKRSYPNVKAYPFGSRITGLGKESSDLDIYLDLEGNYNGSRKYSKDKLKWCVVLTEEYLKRCDQWSKLDPVTSARTPILRAWNTKEKIDCDISFTHGLSHCNTQLIIYLFDLQPVCYYVALYAKEWSRNFSMDGLNTYTLVLLTIFYFQKHKLLPCIHSLQKKCPEPMFVSHWQANFERKSLEELKIARIPETEAEQHIVKFFSFYGSQFCFETRVVCPFLGWAPQKEDFDPLDCEIPLEMENLQQYYKKIDMKEAHPVNDLLSYLKPMVVQDPFELNHNVAKGISPGDVDRFRKFCALTATLLDEVLNEAA